MRRATRWSFFGRMSCVLVLGCSSLACSSGGPKAFQSASPSESATPSISPDAPREEAPDCLVENVEQEPRPEPAIPAPQIAPASGVRATRITVSGGGMPAASGVMIVAFFGAEDCGMPGDGRGDHLLTFTTALEDGSYRETLQWPRMFSPVEGRGLPDDGFQLPYGRYFLIAFPCPSKDRSCFEDFNTGSRIGGPFTYLRS